MQEMQKKMATHSSILARKIHRHRSLACPWGCKGQTWLGLNNSNREYTIQNQNRNSIKSLQSSFEYLFPWLNPQHQIYILRNLKLKLEAKIDPLAYILFFTNRYLCLLGVTRQSEFLKFCALFLNWGLVEKSPCLNGKWEIALISNGYPVP